MSDPSYALQVAEAAALLAETDVTDLVGQNVFDDTSAANETYPRIAIGQHQVLGRRNTCHDAGEVYSTVHIWTSGADARLVAKQISAAVIAVLAPAPPNVLNLTANGFTMKSAVFESVQHLVDTDPTDADSLIGHSVLTFHYNIVPEL